MVSWPELGARVMVRYRLPAGSVPPLTDVIGALLQTAPRIRVQAKTGEIVELDPDDVVATRLLSDKPVRASEIRALEHADALAWPGIERQWLDGWLLRASGGATRRTNSVNPLRGGPRDPSSMLARTEEIYRGLGQPSRFRVPSIAVGMDEPLERAGYTAEGETTTLLAELADHRPRDCAHVELSDRPDEDWLALRSAPDESIFRSMVDSIVLPKTFASCRIDGEVVAKAYGVLHDGLLVVESVVTHPDHRQRGYGARTVGHLMDWALTRGAGGACLQVVADNAPALALYGSLGFRTELYRYHYRSKATAG